MTLVSPDVDGSGGSDNIKFIICVHICCVCGRVCVQDGMGTAETLIGSRFQEYIDKKIKS